MLTSISFFDFVAKRPITVLSTQILSSPTRSRARPFSVYYIHGKKLEGKPLRAPLAGVGCLAEWLTQPPNTVWTMSRSSAQTSTRRPEIIVSFTRSSKAERSFIISLGRRPKRIRPWPNVSQRDWCAKKNRN